MRVVAFLSLLLIGGQANGKAQDLPDIRSVPADLEVPQVITGKPAAGKRVYVTDEVSGVSFVLFLPEDWKPGERWPVIVELPGNGGYRNKLGDECTGRPEGCKLGYGITGGSGAIWVSLPFLDESGKGIALTWWGSKPDHRPDTTVALVKRVVDQICESYGGDRNALILVGFSRGSLACNAIGLQDDEIAGLWRAIICYSHYDGVRESWAYAESDRAAALKRLQRLGKTPQFICHEGIAGPGGMLNATRDYISGVGVTGDFTFVTTGFRNHNDAWVLRPSKARDQLRKWYKAQLSMER